MGSFTPALPDKTQRILQGTIWEIADIDSAMEDRFFAIHCRYFENTPKKTFLKHLREKDRVIVLEDCDGVIQGFSTLKGITVNTGGQTLHAIFSGDTIIEQAYWKSPELVRIFSLYAGQLKKKLGAKTALYWFLISKGYKTYRFLPLYARRFYPTYREPFPEKEKHILDIFAQALFPGEYNPETGLIIMQRPAGNLRAGTAEISAKRLRDADIRFFSQVNPDHMKGVELACITELSSANLRSIALKYFMLGWNGDHDHGQCGRDLFCRA
jgi:hypothetical protein